LWRAQPCTFKTAAPLGCAELSEPRRAAKARATHEAPPRSQAPGRGRPRPWTPEARAGRSRPPPSDLRTPTPRIPLLRTPKAERQTRPATFPALHDSWSGPRNPDQRQAADPITWVLTGKDGPPRSTAPLEARGSRLHRPRSRPRGIVPPNAASCFSVLSVHFFCAFPSVFSPPFRRLRDTQGGPRATPDFAARGVSSRLGLSNALLPSRRLPGLWRRGRVHADGRWAGAYSRENPLHGSSA